MEYQNVIFDVKERIALLTVDRPKMLNAINGQTIDEIRDVSIFFALPSMGDVWKQGLLSVESGKLICAYNSQHAYMTGIVPGKFPIPSWYKRPEVYVGDNDIYLAELEV